MINSLKKKGSLGKSYIHPECEIGGLRVRLTTDISYRPGLGSWSKGDFRVSTTAAAFNNLAVKENIEITKFLPEDDTTEEAIIAVMETQVARVKRVIEG